MASSGPPPLEVHLLSSLRKRNALEVDALRPVVESYLRILGDKTLLRKECSQLDKRTKALAEEKETLKRELLHKDDNEGKAAMAEKLTRKNAELGEEVLQSYKENARIAQELAAKVSEVTTLREDNDRYLTERDKLQLTVSELGERNKELLTQVEEERSTTRVLHVELDTVSQEKKECEQRCEQAKAENAKLVEMLLEMKEKEAERMNAANDYYDSVVSNANLQAARRMGAAQSGAGAIDGDWQGMDASDFAVGVPKMVKHLLPEAHAGACQACSFSNKGTLLATGGADQVIKVWEPKKGAASSTLQGTLGSVLDLEFTPDDGFLVAAGADGALRMWSVDTGRSKHTLTGHKDKVHSVSFGANESKKCVSGGQDRTIRIWDLVKGYCVQTIACGSTCFSVCMGQNGSFVYSGHFDGSVRVWDFRTGSLEKQLPSLHGSQVSSVCVSPVSDRYLVSAGRDNCVKVVDTVTFETVHTLESPSFKTAGAKAVPCISPDDAYVACGSATGAVCVWSTRTGTVDTELKKHKQGVLACAWNPSAAMIASTDQKGDLIIWD